MHIHADRHRPDTDALPAQIGGAAYRTDDGAKTWRNVTPPLPAS